MHTDILRERHGELSRGSPDRLAFKRKALEMLPELDNPRIPDVACGQWYGSMFLVMHRGEP